MAITLNDLKERLEEAYNDIDELNFGHAKTRIINIINILENGGVIIHAIATTESKKVESNGDNEGE